MGVADNRSYKNEYLFTDDTRIVGEDYPSIKKEPKINSTIKENPYRSNVEIEGGEIVLQPDLSALFKAKGKRHSQGGMDVLLKPESFVFSDFKGLEIKEDERELFELKEGGTNTPAQVLKKNIDIKHYNTLVNNLNDPYKDDLAKKSSAMMLEKYLQSLGNIAYIQEGKKGFPQGVPEFSMGTAPVYDTQVKDQIMENKQYMKAGGTTKNPYAQKGTIVNKYGKSYIIDPITGKMSLYEESLQPIVETNSHSPSKPVDSWGPWQGDKMPIFQDRYGVSNAADKFSRLKNWDTVVSELGYKGLKNNKAFQNWLYNSSPENREIVNKWHNQYSKGPNAGMFDSKIGIRWASAINEILDKTNQDKRIPITGVPTLGTPPNLKRMPGTQIQQQQPGPEVPDLNITPQGSKQADWQFTPWQKLSHLYNGLQYANVKRYMPYRSRYNATYVDPALMNPEQAIGDLKGMANQQLSSIRTLNPILRNAQASNISGQVMNQAAGLRSQYDNQNAQILNQARMFNNQVKNNESLVNMGNDQTYYQQAVEGRKNFDNMRQFTANNLMNNILRDVETNQKLAYNLLTQNNPAYGYDWKTGNFYRNQKSILDTQSGTNERYNDLVNLVNQVSDPLERAKLMVKLEGLKTFGNAQQSPSPFKKGGKVKNPYK